jgi:uncharacterized protein YchJ
VIRLAVVLSTLGLLAAMTGCSSSKETVTVTGANTSTSGTSTTTTTATPSETVEEFYKRLLGYTFKGQWGRVWDALHPAQQRYVSRDKFTDCAVESVSDTGELVSVETVAVSDDYLDMKSIPQKSSKAVTYKVTVKSGGQQQTFTETSHAVLVGDHWTWITTDSELDSYKPGECP